MKVSCLNCKRQMKYKNLSTHVCIKWYYCKICGKKFKSEEKLNSHIYAHEVKMKQIEQKKIKENKITTPKRKIYECDCCNKISYETPNFDHNCSFVRIKVSCIKCKKICRGGMRGLDNHNKREPNCNLSKEEKVKNANQKRRLTMLNKSEEEKQKISKKLSERISFVRQNRSEEENLIHNEKVRLGVLKYYNSEKYDPELKSKLVKEGLQNANDKNIKD